MAYYESLTRSLMTSAITDALRKNFQELREQWRSSPQVRACVLDDLLSEELVRDIHAAFPPAERMMYKRSIRENKHVAAQMNLYAPILEDAVFAFQHHNVMAEVAKITDIQGLEPDPDLYAGGISLMGKGAYLRPHLDNSHDRTRGRYRALNLLFYVTPDWSESRGGSLQLWDNGPTGEPRTIPSVFNRLVIMATDQDSWHSVNEVVGEGSRCCVSNYYFTRQSPAAQQYFHATSFREERGRGMKDLAMRVDNALRTMILKATGTMFYRNPHGYNRDQ